MAYISFDPASPNPTTQNGSVCFDGTRNNMKAIRDAGVMQVFPGFNMAVAGGTAEQPATITYSKSTERVRLTITWGSSGGAAGNPQTVVYAYSSNSGSSYDTIGTETITYDANGNVTATTWS